MQKSLMRQVIIEDVKYAIKQDIKHNKCNYLRGRLIQYIEDNHDLTLQYLEKLYIEQAKDFANRKTKFDHYLKEISLFLNRTYKEITLNKLNKLQHLLRN